MKTPAPRLFCTGTRVTWDADGFTWAGVVLSAPLQKAAEPDQYRDVRVDKRNGRRLERSVASVRLRVRDLYHARKV